jgi:hypothetical protein
VRKKPLPLPALTKQSPADQAPYSVGYCRPPLHSRFQPGKSGNPKGRPRGHKNIRTILTEVLKQPIELTEGIKKRVVTKAEAFILTLVNGALSGKPPNPKAAAILVGLLLRAGQLDEESSADSPIVPDAQGEALLRDFLARNPPPSPQKRHRPGRRGGRK